MTATTLAGLPGLKLTKVLMGQTGRYYLIGAGNGRELYTKLKIEHSDQFVDQKFIKVDTLQINFMVTGPQFDLPEGFEFIEERPYMYNGEEVTGAVVGKAWVPMGQFSKSLVDTHVYIRDVIAEPLDAAIVPLLAASGMEQTVSFKALLDMMLETIQQESLTLPPVVYLQGAWETAKKDVYDKAHALHQEKLMKAHGIVDMEPVEPKGAAEASPPAQFPKEPPADIQDDDGNPND